MTRVATLKTTGRSSKKVRQWRYLTSQQSSSKLSNQRGKQSHVAGYVAICDSASPLFCETRVVIRVKWCVSNVGESDRVQKRGLVKDPFLTSSCHQYFATVLPASWQGEGACRRVSLAVGQAKAVAKAAQACRRERNPNPADCTVANTNNLLVRRLTTLIQQHLTWPSQLGVFRYALFIFYSLFVIYTITVSVHSINRCVKGCCFCAGVQHRCSKCSISLEVSPVIAT